MMCIRLATLCVATLLAGNVASAEGWVEYNNERFGFRLSYPPQVFVAERTTEAGDGQAFVAQDADARLLVGALANESGYTPASYQDYIQRSSYSGYDIGYRRLGRTWFVLSGEANGRMFYEKVMFTCGGRLINSFAMIYPSDRRHVFEPIIERIEDTFRPARFCARAAGVALPPASQPGRRATAALRKPFGERSALADRIARERGRNVIVILRRTGPPYDRKILRGYVSRP